MEIVKYSIRKKEVTASVMCIAEGRRTPMHNIGAVMAVMADALLKDTHPCVPSSRINIGCKAFHRPQWPTEPVLCSPSCSIHGFR